MPGRTTPAGIRCRDKFCCPQSPACCWHCGRPGNAPRHPHVLTQQVDDLAFALITPLGAENHYRIGHLHSPTTKKKKYSTHRTACHAHGHNNATHPSAGPMRAASISSLIHALGARVGIKPSRLSKMPRRLAGLRIRVTCSGRGVAAQLKMATRFLVRLRVSAE